MTAQKIIHDQLFLRQKSDLAGKNDLQVADLLITPSLDTNLLCYDRNVEGFYRFSQGVYIFENGKWSANECYRDPNLEAKRYNLKNLDI